MKNYIIILQNTYPTRDYIIMQLETMLLMTFTFTYIRDQSCMRMSRKHVHMHSGYGQWVWPTKLLLVHVKLAHLILSILKPIFHIHMRPVICMSRKHISAYAYRQWYGQPVWLRWPTKIYTIILVKLYTVPLNTKYSVYLRPGSK